MCLFRMDRGFDQNFHDVTIVDMFHVGVSGINSQMASVGDKPHDVATAGDRTDAEDG